MRRAGAAARDPYRCRPSCGGRLAGQVFIEAGERITAPPPEIARIDGEMAGMSMENIDFERNPEVKS